ncbi:MAG: hypothetical protein MJ051_06200 [Akkermansia sp.]|nr:hypothetical protein [Akkermansia sp.]
MSTKLLTLLFAASLLLPLSAQDEDAFDVATDDTAAESTPAKKAADKKLDPKVAARLKKAEAAAKKLEKTKKMRAEKKVKWETNEKKAFKEAAKYNLPVWVLYTDPATCGICVKLDNEVLDTKEFKSAKGLFIGFRSAKPLPQYDCAAGKPMGVVLTPDKKRMNPNAGMAYVPGMAPAQYINMLRKYADRLQQEAEEKVNAELEAARAEAGVAE